MAVDLHTHSSCSDGSFTPTELMGLAYEKKLSAIALTDHDTVSGICEARQAAKALSLTLIPGIEISSLYDLGNSVKEFHILGLGINETDESFLKRMETFGALRQNRNEKMLRLISEKVLQVDEDEFYARFDRSVITRAHFAQYLYEKGAVSSVKEAFDRYLGDGKPCYVPKEGVTAKEAIACILAAGGHPVLAHPTLYRLGASVLEDAVKDLKASGLEGIEAVYSTYTQAQEREIRALAAKYELHMTGGSDFHGTPKPDIQLGTGRGNLYVPDEFAKWLLA